jgi:diguanylate cyclase (GGDEF)-like protein/PAS domain S-box-containing protein
MPKGIPFFIRRARLLAFTVLALSLVIGALVIWNLEQERRDAKRAAALHVATNHALLIDNSLDQALTINYSMAALVRLSRGVPHRFDEAARELLPYFSAVSHIALSPQGVIRYVYPMAGNEKSLGFNQLNDPLQSREARRAMETGQLTLAAPVNLVQGGLGAVARLPIFLDDPAGQKFWGFSNVVVRIDKLLDQANFHQLDTSVMAYELWSDNLVTGERDVIAMSGSGQQHNPVSKTIQVPNGSWTLSIEPINGWTNPWQIISEGAIAGVIGLMLAWLTLLLVRLQQRRIGLQDAVAEQTRELLEARLELQATLDAIPDLLFDIDSNGVIHGYHTNQPELLTVAPERFLGQNFRQFLTPQAIVIVESALAEASEKGVSTGKSYTVPLERGPLILELSVSRKTGDSASTQRFVVLARDITERRLAEAELRVAATAFEAREGMMITDPDGNIVRVNKAFTEITQFSAEEVIGKNPKILRSGRHDQNFYQEMWTKIRAEGSWRGEIWNRRKSGEVFPEWLTITAVRNAQGDITHYVSTLTDITELKQNEERIHHLAFFDPLTHLPNRRLLRDRLEHAMATSLRQNSHGAILFIDLDDFKTLNDNRGHHIGDLLLVAVAGRLRYSVREQDTVARLGGDEFVVVLEGLGEARDDAATYAQRVAEKILVHLNQVYQLEEREYFNTPSIGICLFGDNEVAIEDLLKQADQAMYHAKAAGRNTLRFFDPEMQTLTAQRFALQHEIREALQQNQFQLYYQPQIDAQGNVKGAEALIRWLHPQRGMVSPMEFIPIAEDSGLIIPLGNWIVEAACQQLVKWAESPATANLNLAINVSARQFQHAAFVEQMLDTLQKTGANPQRLKLELTESMLIDNPQDMIIKMDALKARGIKFSLDDFGTGYSSLSYLKRLPINELKIDKSFVNDILTDPNDAAIARMVIRLAQSMELVVIAEGVETKAQRDWLEQEGCYRYQGYYFGKPMPAEDFLPQ